MEAAEPGVQPLAGAIPQRLAACWPKQTALPGCLRSEARWDRGQGIGRSRSVLVLLLVFSVIFSPSLFSLQWFGVVMVPPLSASRYIGCGIAGRPDQAEG